MKKIYMLILGIAAALALVGCGKDDKVSFDTLETARSLAKSNAEYNVKVFRAANPQYSNATYEAQGDSTQSPECPQGDGWASAKLINRDDPKQRMALKCSTVSATVGCMADAEFKTKPYALDDGKCQLPPKVPFPLPKLDK